MSVEIALVLDSEATLGTDQWDNLIRGRGDGDFINIAIRDILHLVQGIRPILHLLLPVQSGTDPKN